MPTTQDPLTARPAPWPCSLVCCWRPPLLALAGAARRHRCSHRPRLEPAAGSLEVIVGYSLIWVHGHNVAWCYADYVDSFGGGQCRVGHAPAWLALGAVCHLAHPPSAIASEHAVGALHALATQCLPVATRWLPVPAWVGSPSPSNDATEAAALLAFIGPVGALTLCLIQGTLGVLAVAHLGAWIFRAFIPSVATPTMLAVPRSRVAAVCDAIGATQGFRPTWWLNNGHLQTFFYGCRAVPMRPIEPDGARWSDRSLQAPLPPPPALETPFHPPPLLPSAPPLPLHRSASTGFHSRCSSSGGARPTAAPFSSSGLTAGLRPTPRLCSSFLASVEPRRAKANPLTTRSPTACGRCGSRPNEP